MKEVETQRGEEMCCGLGVVERKGGHPGETTAGFAPWKPSCRSTQQSSTGWGRFCSPGHIWQCLQLLWVSYLERYYPRLVDRGQG